MLFDYCVPRYKCIYIFKTLCKLTHTCGTLVLVAFKFWTTQKLTTLSLSSLLRPHVKAMGELPSFSLHLLLPKSSSSPHFFIPFLWDIMILVTRALRGRDYFRILTIFIQREFSPKLEKIGDWRKRRTRKKKKVRVEDSIPLEDPRGRWKKLLGGLKLSLSLFGFGCSWVPKNTR